MDIHEHLVALLRDGMVSAGLSQNKLAQQSGVAQGNLSAILAGKAASEATWQKLFDVTHPKESS